MSITFKPGDQIRVKENGRIFTIKSVTEGMYPPIELEDSECLMTPEEIEHINNTDADHVAFNEDGSMKME